MTRVLAAEGVTSPAPDNPLGLVLGGVSASSIPRAKPAPPPGFDGGEEPRVGGRAVSEVSAPAKGRWRPLLP